MITHGVTSRSTKPALSLDDIKAHISELSDDSDVNISRLLSAAVSFVEESLGITLLETTRTMTLSDFPTLNEPVSFEYPPLTSVTSVQYYDLQNASQTLVETTDFNVIAPYRMPGMIVPIPDTNWPDTKARMDAITITYVSGFGTTHASIPENCKHLLRMLVAHYDRNREAVISGTISTDVGLSVDALRRTLFAGFYAGSRN